MTTAGERKTLREKLTGGQVLFGPFLKIPASVVPELVGYAGFDFCIIDLEHSPFSFERAEDMVRAAQVAGLNAVIRTYDSQPSTLVRALDTGCAGVLVPNVKNRQEVETVVRGARFHPLGERGMDPHARAARYRTASTEIFFAHDNEKRLLGVQIEGVAGVENLDEIMGVEGVDLIFVGPYDLSQSLGRPGEIQHPEVRTKVEEIAQRVRSHGKSLGIYADSAEEARHWRACGIQLIAVSIDIYYLLNACRSMVEDLHND